LLAPNSSLQASAFYNSDANGNITCLINASNTPVATYEYDPYGNVISQSGSLADAYLYRFSSKEVHPISGLVYYLYRYYDPNFQRWLNRDPIEEIGGDNLYQFVGNNPTEGVDPLGLATFFPPWRLPGLPLKGIAGGIGGLLAAGGGILMNHCPGLTCHQGTCQACCASGLAVGTAGVLAGVAALESSGWGAWLGIAAGVAGQAALLDGYNSCMAACATKAP
jgi:RHS repeat-associated protein